MHVGQDNRRTDTVAEDGFYDEEERSPITQEGPKQKQKVLVHIPAEVGSQE